MRARAESIASLPNIRTSEDEPPEGTIFEELVRHYQDLTARAEELVVSTVTGEVESGLKAHLQYKHLILRLIGGRVISEGIFIMEHLRKSDLT